MPEANPFDQFDPPKSAAIPQSHPAASKPPAKIASPDATFADRVKDFLGIPRTAENPDTWAHREIGHEGGWERNAANEAIAGYMPDLGKKAFGSLYGPQFGAAYEKAEREALAKYQREAPWYASASSALGGTALSTLAGGRLLGAGGKAAGAAMKAAPKAAKAAEALSGAGGTAAKALRRLAPWTAAGGGAAGALHGEQMTGNSDLSGRLEGAAEGAAEAYRAAGHIPEALVASALGALQGSGEAGPGHRKEGAVAGGIAGLAAGLALPMAGTLGKEVLRGVDAQTGFVGSKAIQATEKQFREWLHIPEGQSLPGPVRAAARRIAGATQHEKLPTEAEISMLNKRREALGYPPLKAYETSGGLRKLARATTLTHDSASQRGQDLAETIGERLAPEIEEQTNRIAPHTNHTAQQEMDRLAEDRSLAAGRDYREPYSKPVEMTPRMMDLLETRKMKQVRAAVRATQEERAMHNPESARIVKELDDLDQYYAKVDKWNSANGGDKALVATKGWDLSGVDPSLRDTAMQKIHGQSIGHAEDFRAKGTPEEEASRTKAREVRDEAFLTSIGAVKRDVPQLPEIPAISGATMHRLQHQAGLEADSLKSTPLEPKSSHAMGVTVGEHAKEIGEHLEAQAHLGEANAAYQARSVRMQALNEGAKYLQKTDREFNAWMDDLLKKVKTPEAKEDLRAQIKNDLRLNLRDMLTGKGKDPTSAMTVWKALDKNMYLRRNIETILGKKEAEYLFEYAHLLRDEARMTQFMSGSGSPTALNQESVKWMGEIGHQWTKGGHMLQFLKDWANEGHRVSQEEAEAIWDFAQGDPNKLVEAAQHQPNGFLAQALRVGTARAAGGYMGGTQAAQESPEGYDANGTPFPPRGPDDPLPSGATPPLQPAPVPTANPFDQFDTANQ